MEKLSRDYKYKCNKFLSAFTGEASADDLIKFLDKEVSASELPGAESDEDYKLIGKVSCTVNKKEGKRNEQEVKNTTRR